MSTVTQITSKAQVEALCILMDSLVNKGFDAQNVFSLSQRTV